MIDSVQKRLRGETGKAPKEAEEGVVGLGESSSKARKDDPPPQKQDVGTNSRLTYLTQLRDHLRSEVGPPSGNVDSQKTDT